MNPCWIDYLKMCRPFELPAPWAGCPVDENSLQGPADPQAAWAELLKRHSPEQLLDSRLAQNVEGSLELHPHLAVPDVGLVVLGEGAATGRIRNVITDAGCLRGDTAPLFAVLGDKRAHDAIAHGQDVVFLAETITDVVLLRSFGWTAAPAVGLDRLRQSDLDLLAEYYGCKCKPPRHEWENKFPEPSGVVAPADKTEKASARTTKLTPPPYSIPSANGHMGNEPQFLQLLLVRWSPATLGPKKLPAIDATITELQQLQQYRGLNLDAIEGWTPTAKHLDTIRFALSRGERTWVKSALLESLEAGIAELDSIATTARALTPASELAEARRRLHDAQRVARFDVSRRSYGEALTNYQRVIEQRVIGPLLEQMHQTGDPHERSLQLQFIELYSLYLAAAPEVRRKTLVDLAEPDAAALPGPDKHVPQWLAMGNQLIKLQKEMLACQTRSTAGPTKSTGLTWKPFPRFTGLG